MLSVPAAISAQQPPQRVQLANPSALEFEVSVDARQLATRYRVEVFAGSDVSALATAARVFDTADITDAGSGRVRVELGPALAGLPDGEYVATLRTVGVQGESMRSSATPRFIVYDSGAGNPARAAEAAPGSAPATDAEKQDERFWTKVAIAVGAGLTLVPFLLR